MDPALMATCFVLVFGIGVWVTSVMMSGEVEDSSAMALAVTVVLLLAVWAIRGLAAVGAFG